MSDSARSTSKVKPARRWGTAGRHLLGAALCLLTIWLALTGFAWYGCVITCCGALMIIHGPGRVIVSAGVYRSGEQITCRYTPRSEGSTYLGGVLVPLFGVATIAAGQAHRSPIFVIGGIFLLCAATLTIVGSLFMRRRNLLCVTPSDLHVRAFVIGMGARARDLTEIRREFVREVVLKWNPDTFGPQVEIAHVDPDTGDTIRTVIRSRQVSVAPENLFNGLTVWTGGADDDPHVLMDRIECVLRDRSAP